MRMLQKPFNSHTSNFLRLVTVAFVHCLLLTLGSGTAFGQWSGPDASGKIYYNGGKVGIGLDNPMAALDLSGALQFSSSVDAATVKSMVIQSRHFSDSQPVVYLWGISRGIDTLLRIGSNHQTLNSPTHLEFFTAPTPTSSGVKHMTINPQGNVGIGVGGGVTEKLVVDGKIKAKEIIVTLDDFPDFVFDEDYELMPLAEVEAAIEAEGHLPGIPSAEEVVEAGVGLGDLQKRMLQKIEELTLHMIDLEKKNDALAQQNTRLSERLASLEQSQ